MPVHASCSVLHRLDTKNFWKVHATLFAGRGCGYPAFCRLNHIQASMAPISRARPLIGDIVEIPVGTKLAYAQFTHKHRQYGSLLRVLPGIRDARPTAFAELASGDHQFIAFFPLGAACNRKIVSVVAHESIPPHAQAFPVFRACVRTKDGRGPYWLWDGVKEWKIGDLQPGMEKLPIRGVVNDTLLVQRILQGWRHEFDA